MMNRFQTLLSNSTCAAIIGANSGVAVARSGPGTFSVNVTVPTDPTTTGTLTQIAVHLEAGIAMDLAGHSSEEARFAVVHDSRPPAITFVTADNWQGLALVHVSA